MLSKCLEDTSKCKVKVEEMSHEGDELVYQKRVFEGVDKNSTIRLKLSKDQFVLKLDSSHPKLFPCRLKCKSFKHSTVKKIKKMVHKAIIRGKRKKLKPFPQTKSYILELINSRLKELPGKLKQTFFIF